MRVDAEHRVAEQPPPIACDIPSPCQHVGRPGDRSGGDVSATRNSSQNRSSTGPRDVPAAIDADPGRDPSRAREVPAVACGKRHDRTFGGVGDIVGRRWPSHHDPSRYADIVTVCATHPSVPAHPASPRGGLGIVWETHHRNAGPTGRCRTATTESARRWQRLGGAADDANDRRRTSG